MTATTAAIEVTKRARMGSLLCVCFGERFALNHYKERNPPRPTLLCPTSQKYAFSRYNPTSARIVFVGDQQETAVHLLASTCTDRCPPLAQSGHRLVHCTCLLLTQSGRLVAPCSSSGPDVTALQIFI